MHAFRGVPLPVCLCVLAQVAVGSSSSTVTLYDVASGRLLAVQRLMAGPGTVECMAAWLPQQVLAAASLAPGGPLPPDGGGVLAGGAWSDAQLQQLGVEAEVASGQLWWHWCVLAACMHAICVLGMQCLCGMHAFWACLGVTHACSRHHNMLRRPRQLSLSPTAWLCFAAGRACWCAGYGPKALLAVVSGSGWLCVFGAEHASGQPWSLIHSSGGLVASGVQAQLAFSPDGTTLAVSSPVAQLLGTGAVALASLGAQPGAVSLYGVSRSGVGLSALLPPLLLQQQGQQQQLPELRLWHQWSLSSTPVGLFVLPSSGLELLQGKQLQPAQVRLFCRRAGVVKHACVQRQASDVAHQKATFVVLGGGTASVQPQTDSAATATAAVCTLHVCHAGAAPVCGARGRPSSGS